MIPKFRIMENAVRGKGVDSTGETLSDAIRNAGIRCGTCECCTELESLPDGIIFCEEYDEVWERNGFCHNHSELT